MNHQRKLLSILLSLALVFGLFAVGTGAVYAEPDDEEDGIMTIFGGEDDTEGEDDYLDYFYQFIHTGEPGDEMRALRPMFFSYGTTDCYISATSDQEYLVLEKGVEPDWSLAVMPDEEGAVEFDGLKIATEYVIWTRVAANDEHEAGEPLTIPFATGLDGYGVNGDVLVGSTLTISYEPEDAEGLSFRWHYDTWEENEDGVQYHTHVPIEGATGTSYTLTEADLDQYIGYEILAGETVIGETDNLYECAVSYGTVEFDTRGGSEIPYLEGLSYGDPITKPEEDPVKEGYTFGGWYFDPDTEYEYPYDFEDAVCTGAYECIMAKWIPLEGPVLSAADFTEDVTPEDWYYDAVDFVAQKGWMKGFGNGWFGPEDLTDRPMAVKVLWNMAGCPESDAELIFTDYEDDFWFADAVRWAGAEGIAEGYDDGTFGAYDYVTREQFLVMLYRYAVKNGVDVSVGEDTNILSFNDYADVSEWAVPAMQWAVGAGLIEGREEGMLSPQEIAMRAEIATILMRYDAVAQD